MIPFLEKSMEELLKDSRALCRLKAEKEQKDEGGGVVVVFQMDFSFKHKGATLMRRRIHILMTILQRKIFHLQNVF